jgi:type I restriction-modification system DNA methylase subunit
MAFRQQEMPTTLGCSIFISKLAPYGTAGVVLANGSMSSEIATEGQIRKELIENDLVDCMVSLPSQLFYNTQIPACLWFLARNKEGNSKFRNRNNEILFIDARELGTMISRKQKELSEKDIAKISDTYHNWRSQTRLRRTGLKPITKTLQAFVNLPTSKMYAKTTTYLHQADTLTLKK